MPMTDARENPIRPFVGVGAVVIDKGRVLLVRRAKPPKAGEWSLPGGAQKLGETTAEAAIREVREETGLTTDLVGLLDVIDFIDRDTDGTIRFHYTLVDYLARPTGDAPAAGSDAAEARFFPLEEALALPLWKETRRVIAMAAEKINASTESDPA